VKPRIKIVDGYLEIPHMPGLGIELDEEEIATHQAKVKAGAYPQVAMDIEKLVPIL
jgi:hypothetical protein